MGKSRLVRTRTASGARPKRRRTSGRPREPPDVVKRTAARRPLSDFAGILSPEAAEELRAAIEEGRKEREPLDRERLKNLIEAFDQSEDTSVLETARRKAQSAGLTRKKVEDLVDEAKKEAWNRRYKKARTEK